MPSLILSAATDARPPPWPAPPRACLPVPAWPRATQALLAPPMPARRRADILAANAQDLASFTGSAAFRTGCCSPRPRRRHGGRACAKSRLCRTRWPAPSRNGRARTACVISRIAQPIGVLGMIYESRPNVGADAAGIAIKSGNAILLRGGSESFHSAAAIHAAIAAGPARSRAAGGLRADRPHHRPRLRRRHAGRAGLIDLIIPRGGKSLVERVQREAACRCWPMPRA
jgi:glutamate-5-semialdehyde dehydrogenase